MSCNTLAAKLPNLRHISLAEVTGTNAEDLMNLTALTALERLELVRWGMSPAGIAAVTRLTTLTEVVLVAGRRGPGRYSEEPIACELIWPSYTTHTETHSPG